MDAFLAVVILNALAAAAIAVMAWLVSFFVRRPAIVHGMWAVVLFRLLAPPLVPVPVVPTSGAGAVLAVPAGESAANVVRAEASRGGAANGLPSPAPEEAPGLVTSPAALLMALAMAIGATVLLGVGVVRARRFSRLLANSWSAPEHLSARVAALSRQLGQRRAPDVRLTTAPLPPLLWPARGRALLVLPAALLASLGEDERDALLVHEIAHLRRRDHWLRFVEVVATALFWWWPVTWWARRQLRRAEELCCDEWVLRALPEAGRAHANGLLKTAAFTSGHALPLPATASTALRTADLRDRLTALLGTPPRPPLPPRARAAFTALFLAALAGFPSSCRPETPGELRVDLAVLVGAPGDPLVKYVGLPVKVLPEATFSAVLEASRQRTLARMATVTPEAKRHAEEGHRQLEAAWRKVDRTRATWSSLPDGARKRVAETAYVDAMREKDEATRMDGAATLGAMAARAAELGWLPPEIDFFALPGPVAQTKTGADGGFTVRIPRTGRFVIAIPLPTQQRWTPVGTVSGYWRVSLDGQARKHVLLGGETGVQGERPFVVAERPTR